MAVTDSSVAGDPRRDLESGGVAVLDAGVSIIDVCRLCQSLLLPDLTFFSCPPPSLCYFALGGRSFFLS